MLLKGTKKRNIHLAVIGALLGIMLCLIPVLSVGVAHADGAPEDTTGGEDAPPKQFSSIVYFSDYEGSSEFAEQLTNISGESVDLIYYNQEVFENVIIDNYGTGDYDEIRDAHVIFEMRYGLKNRDNDTYDLAIVFTLKNLFRKLKDNGCKIMFICGTDESLFNKESVYTDFLQYVDIHVNTDVLSVLLANVFTRESEKNSDNNLHDCTVILDRNIMPVDFNDGDIKEHIYKSWFMYYRLLPYFEEKYSVDLKRKNESYSVGNKYDILKYFLETNYINILCHISGNEFYDLRKKSSVILTSSDLYYGYMLYPKTVNNQTYTVLGNIFAIGGTWGQYSYSSQWTEKMLELRSGVAQYVYNGNEVPDTFFPIYICNADGASISQREDNGCIFASGGINIPKLNEIVEDFLNDESLTVHDNYNGRCSVSHKLLYFSEDGWMEWSMSFMSAFSDMWCVYDFE